MAVVGTKLRKVSDNSIWTITKVISDKQIEVQRDELGKKGKIVKRVINYDDPLENCGFSTKLSKYKVKCFIECEVYANSKKDAINDVSMQIAEDQSYNDKTFDFDFEVV